MSVYRTPAGDLEGHAAGEETGPLLSLDASGRAGRDGRDGDNGSDGSAAGSDGEPGGGAGVAAPGERGGTIALRLSGDPARDAVLRVEGEIAAAGRQRIDEEVDIFRAAQIELRAKGGRGGAGGSGGRGGHGARGRPGSDATRYSSGGDGGRGGDGGDGGDGTSGERGGNGGSIRVRVTEHDTPFVMLVEPNVRGGKGGKSGANGAGGPGGPGGPGGDSYSWTETESYTDEQGNRQTRTTHHRNSGGSNGPPGRDGRPGSAALADGARGGEGQFAIEVEGDDGAVRTYPARYDVRLVAFRHENDNDDGIYEPEEKVVVSQIEVENTGGMPLPKHHDIIVRIVDDGWIAPIAEQTLTLPRGLGPGERVVFDRDRLELHLRLFRPQKTGAPLAAPETLRLCAELPRVRRRFAGFETPASAEQGRIVIRFPIEVSPPTALFSLAPGQATRIRWRIKNASAKAFGRESDLGRAIGARLVLGGGEVGPLGIHFIDETGARVELGTGFDRAIPFLDANQELAMEGTLAIPEDAVPYTSARLVVSAELGHIKDPARVRAVQLEEMTIRVGRPFDARGADVLLLVNNRSNIEEVAAWEERARAARLSISVWDVSLEGGVDVLRRVAAGDARYALAIVLDDAYDTAVGVRHAGTLIAKSTLLELARRGTHVLYVGSGDGDDLESLLVPPPGDTDEAETRKLQAAVLDACERDSIGASVIRVRARAWYYWPWSEPKASALASRAGGIADLLDHRFPERRYVVVHRFTPEVTRRVAFARLISLGTIEVRRSLDVARGAIARAAAPGTSAAVLHALPFDAKLRLLESDLPFDANDDAVDPIVAATLMPLLREQRALLQHGWRRSNLARSLPLLEQLATSAFASVSADDAGPRTRRFIELVAWLDLVARDHTRLWEWIPPFTFARRGPQLRSVVRKTLARILERVAAPKALLVAIATRRKALRKLSDARALDFATKHLDLEGFTTDEPALEDGLINHERDEGLVLAESHRNARAADVTSSAADARRSLLRTESCADLLARAVPSRVATNAESDAADPEAEADEEGSALALATLRD